MYESKGRVPFNLIVFCLPALSFILKCVLVENRAGLLLSVYIAQYASFDLKSLKCVHIDFYISSAFRIKEETLRLGVQQAAANSRSIDRDRLSFSLSLSLSCPSDFLFE